MPAAGRRNYTRASAPLARNTPAFSHLGFGSYSAHAVAKSSKPTWGVGVFLPNSCAGPKAQEGNVVAGSSLPTRPLLSQTCVIFAADLEVNNLHPTGDSFSRIDTGAVRRCGPKRFWQEVTLAAHNPATHVACGISRPLLSCPPAPGQFHPCSAAAQATHFFQIGYQESRHRCCQ